MKEKLTDRRLKALRPQAKPYELMDTDATAFGVRVAPSGEKTFILYRRFPGSKAPVRRPLGRYPETSLAAARDVARDWNAKIRRGIDPSREEKRNEQAAIEAERIRKANTFGAALETYLKRKAKLRSIRVMERELRREFPSWTDKSLLDITPSMVKSAIRAIVDDRGVETHAHMVYALLRGFLSWCVDTDDYGLEKSPCTGIKPTVLIGERNVGSRVLRDYELAAYWRAGETLGYPYGPLYRLLALTALRRNEAADASWGEFDMSAGVWTIPAERMKGKPGKAAAHAVPLTDDILALLSELPRYPGGDYVFSTAAGRSPVTGFSGAKKQLDAAMRAILAEQGKPFEPFKVHDVRRTCRTRFGALPIEDVVRELLLAHARPGMHKIYDLHAYQDEKRHALELWHAKLRAIVSPAPDAGNVVALRPTG